MPIMKTAGYFCRMTVSRRLRGRSGYIVEQFFGVKECQFFGQVGIARPAQLGEQFLREPLGAHQDFPNLADDRLSEIRDCAARR